MFVLIRLKWAHIIDYEVEEGWFIKLISGTDIRSEKPKNDLYKCDFRKPLTIQAFYKWTSFVVPEKLFGALYLDWHPSFL